jgi:hypothetical protein
MDNKFLKIISRCLATLLILALLVTSLPGEAPTVFAAPGDTTRVSVDSSGAQANGRSFGSSISGDGRYIAFESDASNLVSGDTNGTGDIFVHDRQTGATTRVSVDSSGIEANGGSGAPSISSDGRFVAFYSYASNLVSGDTNGMVDIFVHDRQTGETTRVSVDSNGVEANGNSADVYFAVSISDDGRYVSFQSEASNLVSGDTNGANDIFVHDRQTHVTTRVSVDSSRAEANAGSLAPVISGNGRYIVFSSGATNLVAGDTNNKPDIFVHDYQTGATTLASVNSSGMQADGGGNSPDISGDGRYVVFKSKSNNLAPETEDYEALIYVHDRQTGQTTLASAYTGGGIMEVGDVDQPTISQNGRYVAFSLYEKGNNDGISNIWVRDLQLGISVEVAYGDSSSYGPSLTADGNVVAFWSLASNLVSGDTNGTGDVFVSEVAYGPDQNPTVVSVTPECGSYSSLCPYPTPASVSFIVVFSEPVTGVTADDFTLTMLEDVTGASITGVNGSGTEYFVTVDTGTGEGYLDLDVLDDDSILDSNLNPLGGVGVSNGDFTNGHRYRIDKNDPTVTGITLANPNPTASEQVNFTVTFSENVWPVNPSDFVLTTTGNIAGATVTGITPGEDEYRSEKTFTVTVNTGTGDGTLRLDLIDDDSIRDDLDHPLGGVGEGNGNFTLGETYTIQKETPTAPSVTSSLRADPNPTLADLVSFTVTFSEAVSGVDPDDFTVTTMGNLTGAFVANASGSGNTYTVIAATGNGDGSLRLDVVDNDSIQNAFGIPLGGIGAGNGNFTSGESYDVDKSVPYVTGSLRADANPTTAVSVSFTVGFSEAVSGVDASDFFVSTTGSISGTAITSVNGSGNLYNVAVSTGNGDGTLRLDVLDNDSIVDASGYALGGPGIGNGNFTTGEEYTINRTPVQLFTDTIRSNGKNDGWVLESSEDSEQGGIKDSVNTTFVLGDDDQDRQFRSILHFPTFYIPNNAVITRALLMIKGEALVGTDPFTTHGNILVDIRSGSFGFIGPFPYRGLQISDFQSPSHMDAVGMIENNPFNGWYWAWLDSSAFNYIKLNGITQIRLRFQIGDDDDLSGDYLRFYSGDYEDLALRPRLVIEYYTTR